MKELSQFKRIGSFGHLKDANRICLGSGDRQCKQGKVDPTTHSSMVTDFFRSICNEN